MYLGELEIPEMKCLKEYGNSMLDLFDCGFRLRDIRTERIPTLKTLRLSTATTEISLEEVLQNFIEEDLFSGIRNLHVTNLHPADLIAELRTAFPNLERLSIRQSDKEECPPIQPYLQACGSLGLKYLELDLSNGYFRGLQGFIRGFFNCGRLLSGTGRIMLGFIFKYESSSALN